MLEHCFGKWSICRLSNAYLSWFTYSKSWCSTTTLNCHRAIIWMGEVCTLFFGPNAVDGFLLAMFWWNFSEFRGTTRGTTRLKRHRFGTSDWTTTLKRRWHWGLSHFVSPQKLKVVFSHRWIRTKIHHKHESLDDILIYCVPQEGLNFDRWKNTRKKAVIFWYILHLVKTQSLKELKNHQSHDGSMYICMVF